MAFRDTGVAAKNQRRSGWEDADFPIVCETCLGANPYVRMTKAPFDKECKVCTRPFTVFRWKPGAKARHKKTEICQVCSKLKNVCQTCLLDLEFGLPVQVRDSQLPQLDDIPHSDVNREYLQDQAERAIAAGQLTYEEQHKAISENLKKLVRKEPFYTRNRAHICSFFLKGSCTRGNLCPYRHEMPDDNPELAQQNIKDRFYGVNDPVARKMLGKIEDKGDPTAPPANEAITTLYIGGVLPHITEEDIRDNFYGYGEITSLSTVPDKQCAFVTYSTREAAQRAINTLYGKITVKGVPLRLAWGRSAPTDYQGRPPPQHAYPALNPPVTPYMARLPPPPGIPPPPSGLPPPIPGAAPPMPLTLARPPGLSSAPPVSLDAVTPTPIYYPSMDPSQFGSRPADAPPPGQPAKKKVKTGPTTSAPVPESSTTTTSTSGY